MKFFTSEWWFDCQGEGDGGAAIAGYVAHFAAIRDRLPPALLALNETISLHDGVLEHLHVSIADASALLWVRLRDGARVELFYGGVDEFESVQSPEQAFPGPGYGDLGYDEADVLPDGRFEHRLLFATSIELRLRFRTIELRTVDVRP